MILRKRERRGRPKLACIVEWCNKVPRDQGGVSEGGVVAVGEPFCPDHDWDDYHLSWCTGCEERAELHARRLRVVR